MDGGQKGMSGQGLKGRARLSRSSLLLFGAIFALIGGTIIYLSFAANPNLPGDCNNDNTVNGTDLSALQTSYSSTTSLACDFNNDKVVNAADLSTLLSYYGKSYTGLPTVTISANPSTINSGGSSTITWSSTNATSCTASGAWSGTKATSGTQSVSPTSTSTYSLGCTGSGGTSNASTTVTVSNSGLTSWNPYVTFYGVDPTNAPQKGLATRVPVLTTVDKILGTATNANGGATEFGAGTSFPKHLVEDPNRTDLPVWGGTGGYTHGGQGQPLSNEIPNDYAFVQINHLHVLSTNRKIFASGNSGDDGDGTTNVEDASLTTRTLYMRSIHIEISRHWGTIQRTDGTIQGPFVTPYNISGNTGSSPMVGLPSVGSYIDVQGFIRWDTLHVGTAGHSFSGWEIHPITAWQYSATQ